MHRSADRPNSRVSQTRIRKPSRNPRAALVREVARDDQVVQFREAQAAILFEVVQQPLQASLDRRIGGEVQIAQMQQADRPGG